MARFKEQNVDIIIEKDAFNIFLKDIKAELGISKVFIPEGNRDTYNKIFIKYPEMKDQLSDLDVNIIKDFGELKKALKFK